MIGRATALDQPGRREVSSHFVGDSISRSRCAAWTRRVRYVMRHLLQPRSTTVDGHTPCASRYHPLPFIRYALIV